MSSAAETLGLPPRDRVRARVAAIALPRPELAVLLVLAGVLYLWALDQNGYANEYYSAAVRSMSESWHAFFYGSFDTSGVMTVDKPPLALWVQALSVKAFGYSSWSILVPQALMGVASVGLTYDLTRRRFGRFAGFAAGLALALTPVFVAISRHNNPDALLILCCVAAIWFVVRGLEDGRTRWLVLAGVAVGLGFETKMSAALLVVPAIVAAWLWVAPRGRLAAIRQLLAGGAAMVAVGIAWPLLVALTPAADRPWVSGTSDNSIWSLILGYNGLGRLLGQDGGAAAGGGGGLLGGDTGILRLLDQSLGGQAGWLLGVAVVAAIAIALVTRLRRDDARTGWLIAVGGTFATTAVAFSFAKGIFHPYYVAQLAPFTAALVGAGAGQIADRRFPGHLVGPVAILAGVVAEVMIIKDHPGELDWLPIVLIAVGTACAVALVAARYSPRLRAVIVAVAFGALMIAPGTWAVQTLGHATSGTFPAGGSESTSASGGGGAPAGGFGASGAGAPTDGGASGSSGSASATSATAMPQGGGMFGGNENLAEAVDYATAHGGGTIAVASQSGAASSMIESGADVAAIGGFSGQESEVSIDWLADAIEDGRIRWVLTDGGAGVMAQDDRVGASEVMAAVEETCTKTSIDGLYDCRGDADALRALAS